MLNAEYHVRHPSRHHPHPGTRDSASGSSVELGQGRLHLQHPVATPRHGNWNLPLLPAPAARHERQCQLHPSHPFRALHGGTVSLVRERPQIHGAQDRLGAIEPHSLQVVLWHLRLEYLVNDSERWSSWRTISHATGTIRWVVAGSCTAIRSSSST